MHARARGCSSDRTWHTEGMQAPQCYRVVWFDCICRCSSSPDRAVEHASPKAEALAHVAEQAVPVHVPSDCDLQHGRGDVQPDPAVPCLTQDICKQVSTTASASAR